MKHRDHRALCDYAARFHTAQGPVWAEIRNVSEFGARVAGLFESPGSRVALVLRMSEIRGRVVWRRAGLVGLRFDRPLSDAEMAMIRGTVEASRAVRNTAGYHRFREL
ncbi:PilZ domain-containing protein [Roseisalinus antarcticus]|uniref:PilZ domain-containing protein n=1 Tax=Roseisalinus antarcticus TaxID=254357 RepID=A0A1Y5TRF1_9RHOB|nr:PilZ domain-containing protein [Roseisalinus antarcticus]SLN66470.1 hypothetical protein ROA7023_03153 [Roseisalinus antarcticus]